MRKASSVRPKRALSYCGVILGAQLLVTELALWAQTPAQSLTPAVTNILQLRSLASQKPDTSYSLRIEGDVWWARPAEGRFVLRDGSGAAELEMDLPATTVRQGQRVRLEGNGPIVIKGTGLKIGVRGPTVDDNGVHNMVEKSGAAYLRAGMHPIRLEWFNGVEKFGLQAEYEGPELLRQRIPDSALFRRNSATAGDDASTNVEHGLEYRCYAVAGEALPDFSRLAVIKSGTAANFDLGVRSGDDHVGLQFAGYLAVPREGLYTFYLKSDDGSRLFISDPTTLRMATIGPATYPQPRRVAIGQRLRDGEDGEWTEMEGRVAFAREQSGGLRMELSAGAGRARVEIADGAGLSAAGLLNSRVRVTGFCESAFTIDGEKVPGVLLVPGAGNIEVLKTSANTARAGDAGAGIPHALHTAVEVHQLKREEAERRYPVQLRGVITSVLPEHQAFTIQDATRGLYVVDFSQSRADPPQIGEYFEIEGTTDPSLFAPIVNAQRVRSLGAGRLPDPVQPTWDQLMNGSLDAQYVEIQGIVTAVQTNGVTLRARGGVIRVELRVTGVKPGDLSHYQNALVRIRGCLFASWDYLTHQVLAGQVRINDADILVDQPAPEDLFSSPAKTPAELLLFDPRAGAFERVKVSGQIVCVRDTEYFMTDGRRGVRFIPTQAIGLQEGDKVEVVGFPDLFGGASPVLREAVVRKVGNAALPAPTKLSADNLIRADNDSMRVRVEGKLVSERTTRADQILELQSGVRTFVARLGATNETAPSPPIGSQLELTGVYAARGNNRVAGQDVGSFELLLGSAADIRVLARPPWWTLERLLIIVGALACVLIVTVLWITQLSRTVEKRTAQLETEIRERQRIENQRAMEQERARIAQDLHDELGSGITEIGMLAARAKSATAIEEKRSGYLEQMGRKAREMVTALDEIVWAMNPKHDSLGSVVSYFCLYADRFLGLANITWQLEDTAGPPDHVLDSRQRHQLFLAFKEALTNVVRHADATEVRLSVRVERGEVQLAISDNGRGLPAGARTEEMDGVANMRARIEKLGGRFEVASEAGRGTTLRFCLPSS